MKSLSFVLKIRKRLPKFLLKPIKNKLVICPIFKKNNESQTFVSQIQIEMY